MEGMDIISSDYSMQAPNFFTRPIFTSPEIKFVFTCSYTISVYPSLDQNITDFLVSVSLEQFLCYSETHALIRENIKRNMPIFVDDKVVDNLIKGAYRQAEEALASIPAIDADVYVRCRFTVRHNIRPTHIAGMVPADDSSIESLETREVSSGSCCICLEDFSEVGASMPCQHVFHRDCIVKSLRVNRTCPMCRFQMP